MVRRLKSRRVASRQRAAQGSNPMRVSPLIVLLLASALAARAEERVAVDPARRDPQGLLVHEVRSTYQADGTQIRILTPDQLPVGRKYAAVYVLPVEAGAENRYGDGLREIQSLALHNRHAAIFIAPTFSHLPWYADHPTNRALRQESYFLQVVIPFVERTYPVRTEAEARLLLGFSKSGWGAWTLLLRHPDRFGKAAAWDAPLALDAPGKYGSGPIFGTAENFAGYRIDKLLARKAANLGDRPRLILTGYGNFRGEHAATHDWLRKLNIAHVYRDGPARRHDWHSGWVGEAVELLLAPQ